MKTISKILIFVSMSLALSGCDDFLTKEPETNLSPNTFFSSEAELELWTNRFYSLFAGPDTDAIQVSDIQIAKNLSSVQQGTRSPATENWGTSAWAYLRYINYYLERSGNCSDETVRQRYDGVAYFFRALFYFEKVRKYGDIPYYDFVIPSNDWASLKRPRDSRGFVMKKVMEDLDRAITDLPTTGRATRSTASRRKPNRPPPRTDRTVPTVPPRTTDRPTDDVRTVRTYVRRPTTYGRYGPYVRPPYVTVTLPSVPTGPGRTAVRPVRPYVRVRRGTK